MSETLYEMKLGLIKEFSQPVLKGIILKEYKRLMEKAVEKFGEYPEAGLSLRHLSFCTEELVDAFLSGINLPFLNDTYIDLLEKVRVDTKFNFNDFRASSQELSYEEVANIVQKIFSNVGNLQRGKELCVEHISLQRKAVTYLDGFKKTVEQIVLNNEVFFFGMTMANKKRFFEEHISDVVNVVASIKANIADLDSCVTNSLGPKLNMLLRAESSVRLLSKYQEMEQWQNTGESLFKTTPPESPDFNVDKL